MNFRVLKVAAAIVVSAVPPVVGAVHWLGGLERKVEVTSVLHGEQIADLKEDMGDLRAALKEQREDTKELLRIMRRQEKKDGK